MKRKLLSCLLVMVCSFACLLFVACNKQEDKGQQQTTFAVNFYDYDGTRLGIPTSEQDDTIIYTQYVKRGESAIAPAVPGRDGYMFKGWSKEFENVTSNLEIYAEYASVCVVVFKDYDNSILKTELVSYGGDATPPEAPKRNSYRFVGWSGQYTRVLSDTEIIAEYVEQFTVSFVNYDDSLISTQLVDKGKDAIAPQAREIKAKPDSEDGVYEFDAWSADYHNVQKNLVLKATFKIKTYTVTFVDYDGTVLGEPQTVKHGSSAVAPDMTGKMYLNTSGTTKAGYKFKNFDKSFENVTQNMVITAVYETIEQPIIFAETKTFNQGTTTAKIGIYVITPMPVCGLKVKVYYDNEVLSLKNIQAKSKFADGYIQTNAKENYVEFIWTSSKDLTFANNFAEIFELEFELNSYQAAGTYELSLDSEETQYTYTQENFPQEQEIIVVPGAVVLTEKEGN